MNNNVSTIKSGEGVKITVADRVFEQLSDAIISGKIAAGSKISEPDLAKKFNVSRAPLREAIGRLEACNLVTRKPNVGARVVELSFKELIEIYRIREALEGMAARMAAENMNDEEIAQLRQMLSEEQIGQANESDMNHDFHYAIVQGSRNSRLNHLLCDDLYSLLRMYRMQLGRANSQHSNANAEHRAILDAISEHDGEMAEVMMRRHIQKSRQHIEQMFQQQMES